MKPTILIVIEKIISSELDDINDKLLKNYDSKLISHLNVSDLKKKKT
jgi:hypothetical protein